MERLTTLFRDAGCEPLEQFVPDSRLPNLVCTLEGSALGVVVVGAHYDKVEAGAGVIDNWAGVVLLAALYGAVAAELPGRSFSFIGFTDEEVGLVGSRGFVAQLGDAEDRARTCVVPRARDQRRFAQAVRSRLRGGGTSFAESAHPAGPYERLLAVQRAGIQTISVMGLRHRHVGRLHTEFDRFDSIEPDHFLEAYVVLRAFLLDLSQDVSPERG